jgi:ankyrin repeat protein
MAGPIRPSHGTGGEASSFYMACREGDLEMVNRLLKTMTARDINRIEESNSSTALHAASYYGHADVVKRLLEVGASTHTHNGHGLTPEQEAQKQDVKNVFAQFKSKK